MLMFTIISNDISTTRLIHPSRSSPVNYSCLSLLKTYLDILHIWQQLRFFKYLAIGIDFFFLKFFIAFFSVIFVVEIPSRFTYFYISRWFIVLLNGMCFVRCVCSMSIFRFVFLIVNFLRLKFVAIYLFPRNISRLSLCFILHIVLFFFVIFLSGFFFL